MLKKKLKVIIFLIPLFLCLFIQISCTSPTLYLKENDSKENTCEIQFKRIRNVIGGGGPSYTLVDMGDDIRPNGRIIIDTRVNPYKFYHDTGKQLPPNVAYLSMLGVKPIINGLAAIMVVDRSGRVRAVDIFNEYRQGVAAIWEPEPFFMESLLPHTTTRKILSEPPPLITESRYPFAFISAEGRVQLLQIAREMPAGKSLNLFYFYSQYNRDTCTAIASTLDEAFSICSRSVQIIGTTGSGSDLLTWRRPPGKMRLVVVSPHIEVACYKGEFFVEAGKSYLVEFDRSQGTFNIVEKPALPVDK